MRPHRLAVGAAVVFLAVHLLVTFLGRFSVLLSDSALILIAFFTTAACWRHGKRLHGSVRTKWQLLAMGLGFWTVGQSIFTYVDCFRHYQPVAGNSDFYFFLWGVPVLVAIASTDEDSEDSALLLVLDSVQAVLAVLLTYLELFAPQSISLSATGLGMSDTSLLTLYTGECLVLLLAASLRLLSRPPREQQHFYKVLCVFLWVYTAVSIPANYFDYLWKGSSGTAVDVAWDVPFLLLLLMGFASRRGRNPLRPSSDPPQHTALVLIIYNSCAALFTIAVLILGAHICQRHAFLGTAAMAVSLFSFTLRAALLQTRYMQAQRALLQSERALRAANDRLKEISLSDPLTGVPNRRHFEQVLDAEWKRALRSGASLSLLMIDVDHFKQINDNLGHLRGDECLVMVAHTLRQSLRRSGEVVARYGGEEFVAVLPNLDEHGAFTLAEEIRYSITQLCVSPDYRAEPWFLTASIGVCSVCPSPENSPGDLVAAADTAMYRAKQQGRNRTEAATEEDLAPSLLPSLS